MVQLHGNGVQIYQSLCPGQPVPQPRHATLRTLYHPHTAVEVLDSASLILFFPAPQTVTGEDILEFHIHGGNAVVKSVLSAIPLAATSDSAPQPESHTIRYAEPGEFTRRAFYNNRLDLTQVEALGDLLSAETEQQRRIAVKGSSAVLAQRYESWREQLLFARGELEALIDFSEDQHLDETPSSLIESVKEQILALKVQLQASIKNASRGELLRDGIDLALVGAPNAGKSSLLNCIVGREAAIVSQEAGTTRDVIEVGIDIGGYYCKFGDLAGLRNQSSAQEFTISNTEREGIKRAKERALIADVIVVIIPVERRSSSDGRDITTVDVNPEVELTLRLCDIGKQTVVYVINKTDLAESSEDVQGLQGLLEQKISDNNLPPSPLPILAISCLQDQHPRRVSRGVEGLVKSLEVLFKDLTATSGVGSAGWESSLGATERQRLLLEQCLDDLQAFLDQTPWESIDQGLGNEGVDVVLAAESLRGAANCLARITGTGEVANVEEVLGVVFEKYSRSAISFVVFLLLTISCQVLCREMMHLD
ncbi:MAG: hypothetical protein Q9182_004984 [Xanthomendoza sp. 2 TL-2023]